MINNVSIDIETFGTSPDCIIHEIAITLFDTQVRETLSWTIDWKNQNRKFEPNTIHWWMTKSRVMRERVTNDENRVSLVDALADIEGYITKEDFVWANSPRFDCGILENAFKQIGKNVPWDFRKERDFRTLLAISPIDKEKFGIENLAPHTAAGDSLYQAELILSSLKQLSTKDDMTFGLKLFDKTI